MASVELTLEDCTRSVAWALGEAEKIPFKRNAWNAKEFLIKEHCLGLADAGATVYKCMVGFNIDFDLRCTCCGAILEMGTVDIQGPVHDPADESGPVVLARSATELATALGSRPPERRSSVQAAAYIWERLRRAELCSCLG